MVDKKLIKNIDYFLLLSIYLICAIGIVAISSATHVQETGSYSMVIRQILWLAIGTVAFIIIISLDYNLIGSYSTYIYFLNLILLLLVMVIGHKSNGAQSWIQLGSFMLQPSEFAKIAIIVTLSKYLSGKEGPLNNLKDILTVGFHVGLPFLLIFIQPDLGTALVFIAIMIGMLFIFGIDFRWIVVGGLTIAVATPLIWLFALKEHQKWRILTFLNPSLDPLGYGYHAIQSKIAIGSGMITGRGLFNGTQTQLDFLPEAHTDFIFSVVGEELGFIGTMTVVILYFIIVYRIIRIAMNAKDKFGMYICVGVVSMLLFQIFENIGMTIGLMPITGITLPFMSYGGSSLLANMLAIGLVINVGMRRQKINF
ncbi:rod shape-determining protein RodA [Calorimonas adulescens]|uniref:Peptidoglycan glycosyltransferase RodA n=1 Tax=Calorimonas adulescens TaxID=2606906 RepID=A0A5D8QCG9_9THEO|nr:rod shape-determining protein RodA [Calorimonas adulescens]TZE82241.1 rod shape-determining protein RodA [Calorimonas adulescens]